MKHFRPTQIELVNLSGKKYRKFTEKWGLDYLPITGLNPCRFMYECACEGLCFTTINNYVSGINLLSKLNDGEDFREDFGVNLMVKGLRRMLNSTVKPKDPLLPTDLIDIFQKVNLSDHKQLSVWIGILICFRTMIRKCHIFPTKEVSDHLLSRADISWKPWGFELSVPTSKTDQYKQKDFKTPITASDSQLCVVRQLKIYWQKGQVGDHLPIVANLDGSPIYYDFALKCLKKWCRECKLDKDVGFHSLRRGAATHMNNLGAGLHDIKVEGDWQCMSVLLYLASSLSHRLSIDRIVASSLP